MAFAVCRRSVTVIAWLYLRRDHTSMYGCSTAVAVARGPGVLIVVLCVLCTDWLCVMCTHRVCHQLVGEYLVTLQKLRVQFSTIKSSWAGSRCTAEGFFSQSPSSGTATLLLVMHGSSSWIHQLPFNTLYTSGCQ